MQETKRMTMAMLNHQFTEELQKMHKFIWNVNKLTAV